MDFVISWLAWVRSSVDSSCYPFFLRQNTHKTEQILDQITTFSLRYELCTESL